MGALSLDGTDDYLEFAGTLPFTAAPFTFGVWFRPASDTPNFPMLMGFWNASAGHDDGYYLGHHSQQASKRIAFGSRRAGDPAEAVTSDTYALSTWHAAMGVAASATDRKVYGNNGGEGSNTTDTHPRATLNRITFGRRTAATPGSYLKGHLGYGFLWDDALTSTERGDWYAGDVIEAKLVAFYDFTVAPVDGVYANLLNPGTYDLTVNGATFDSGQTPPVTYDFGGGGSTVTFDATVAGQAAITAAIVETRAFATTVAGQAQVAADTVLTRAFEAAVAAAAAITADFETDNTVAFDTAITAGATITAELARHVAYDALVNGQATIAAAADATKLFEAVAAGTAVVIAGFQIEGEEASVILDTTDLQTYLVTGVF